MTDFRLSRLPYLALIVALLGCRPHVPVDTAAAWAELPPCPEQRDGPYYFGANYDANALKSGFLTLLSTAQAVSLSCGPDRLETYRLLFLPTSTSAFVVTVTRINGRGQVSATELARNLDPHQQLLLKTTTTRTVPEADLQSLRRGLERATFSTMPEDQTLHPEDGEMIAVEARTAAGYRMVTRVSPPDGPFARTAYMFFDLAGLPYPDVPRLPWQH